MTPRERLVIALRDIQARIATCKSAMIHHRIGPLAWATVLGGLEMAVWGLANAIKNLEDKNLEDK